MILSPGCHYLNRFTPVMSKTNISIIGDGNSLDDIVITCENGVGVVFLNVSQLELKGLTFTQCNMTGQNLNKTLSNIKGMSVFSLVFDIPTSVEVTLLIANSIDVTIDKVYINDTHGYGLIAINVLESFVITSSVISNNYNRDCYYVNPSYYHGIGGGAIILYHDTKLPSTQSHLAITNTFFYTTQIVAIPHFQIFMLRTQIPFSYTMLTQYVIGGGGGLTIYLIHHGYDATLDISKCYFQNNAACFGGAIYVGQGITIVTDMTSLVRSYLHFVFPIYLWILMGIYTFLSRYQWWQRQWTNTNPAQVFASVMLTSYISILHACITALRITHLDNADHPWRWTIDPSVVCFSPEHAPLGTLSTSLSILGWSSTVPSIVILRFCIQSIKYSTPGYFCSIISSCTHLLQTI